jgi:hypothetical protein
MATVLALLAFGWLGHLVRKAHEAQQTDHALLVATHQFIKPQPVVRQARSVDVKPKRVEVKSWLPSIDQAKRAPGGAAFG